MRKSINGRSSLGITLVSLVVTIIILIILAGVSINLTLGENGIITMAKQAKENTELAKIEEETMLNELYTQIEAEGGSTSYDSIAKLTEFKKAIADYIEEAGGVKPEYTSDANTFRESIKGIVKEVTKNATATAEDIAEGKTAWVNGELITGNVSYKSGQLCFEEVPYTDMGYGYLEDYPYYNPTYKLNLNKDYEVIIIYGTCSQTYAKNWTLMRGTERLDTNSVFQGTNLIASSANDKFVLLNVKQDDLIIFGKTNDGTGSSWVKVFGAYIK